MDKNDLIEAIASSADLPKSAAGRALDALTTIISTALKGGEDVTLVGFGTFAVKARAARDGRNPQTGAIIKIAASNTPSFKAGKSLKDAVNETLVAITQYQLCESLGIGLRQPKRWLNSGNLQTRCLNASLATFLSALIWAGWHTA